MRLAGPRRWWIGKQFAAAEEIAGQIVRQLPDCAGALVLLGIVARKTDRAAQAVEWLRKASLCRPDDASIRCELGRALADCRRLDEAAAEFRRAIEIESERRGGVSESWRGARATRSARGGAAVVPPGG